MRTTSVRLVTLAIGCSIALAACGGGASGDQDKKSLVKDEVVMTTPEATQAVDSVVWGLPER